MFSEGQVLNGTYQILEKIGIGGGGIVYKAYHLRLNQFVAIKMIKSDVKDKIDIHGESDILKQLKHPYLPRIFDFLINDGNIYIVMDYIPGENFQKAIERGEKFSLERVLKWAKQLCEAVKYLHTRVPVILHCDIKPANIILLPTDDICLIDFNISMFMTGKAKTIGFSKGYTAPELFDDVTDMVEDTYGNAFTNLLSPDHWESKNTNNTFEDSNGWSDVVLSLSSYPTVRSDIYSIGASLFSIVSGKVPDFNMPKSEVDFYLKNCEESLKYIIEKAMDKDSKKRYSSAEEMLYDLDHKEDFDVENRKRKARKRIGIIAASAALIVSVVAGFVAYSMTNSIKQDQYFNYIENAEKAIYENDLDKALNNAISARKLYSNLADSYVIEALTFYRARNYDKCIEYVERIIDTFGKQFEKDDKDGLASLWMISAESDFMNEKYKDAIEKFEISLQYSQNNAEVYRDYAIALARTEKIEEAEKAAEMAKSLNLDNASLELVESEIFFKTGRYEDAEKACCSAIEKIADPIIKERAVITATKIYMEGYEAIDSSYKKAESLLETTMKENAFANSVALKEKLGEIYVLLARDGSNSKDYYEKAANCYKEIIQQGNTSFYLWNNLIVIYQEANDFNKAKELLSEMEELYKDDYRVPMLWAIIEADENSMNENVNRNYISFFEHYERAKELYANSEASQVGDLRMSMLEELAKELKDGGW